MVFFQFKIKGTSQVNICKTMNESKYQRITWDAFFTILEEKNLQVYKDSSSCFLKIMKKNSVRNNHLLETPTSAFCVNPSADVYLC